MSPEIARLYAHVLPVFWPYLWLQLRWIFKRQDGELRTLLISVSKWGHVYIVQAGDHGRAYRKPAAVKPSWDDPVWESHIAPNLVGGSLKDSQNPPTDEISLSGSVIFPCLRGRCTAGAEGGAPYPDTS
ncbi:hypothetical protein BBF93_03410 [Hyphomonas sp. CACIAM 19H1]|nr:hypothetical protein BBF93_03410 [Hyphomonas sp. CACIAM 19H1]